MPTNDASTELAGDRLPGSAASPADWRRAGILVALLSIALFVTAPQATRQLPVIPAFVPAYNAAIIILDLITAVLLYVQYREFGRSSFLALACGYIFTSLVVMAHAASFPDTFVAGSLIGGEQTTAWLWMAWHGVFPLFVAAYAILARRERAEPSASPIPQHGRRWVIATAVLAATLIVLTMVEDRWLPELMVGSNYRSPATRLVLSLAWIAHIASLILLAAGTRLQRAIDLWVAVVLVASAIDLALSALLVDGRYQLGFYAGRFYGLFAASVVLAILLRQTLGAYAGLGRASAWLRDSEERFRLAIELADLATWDWDLRSGKTAWNDRHYRIQGYAVGEIEPSYEAWMARVHPDDLAATEAAIDEARRTGREYVHAFRNRLPDGSVRWCAARGRFFYENGEATRMIGVMEDVTERVQAEEYQRFLLAELQHRVRNTLAVIRSIARRTAASNDSVEDYTAHFDGRLNAFARAQAAVTRDPAGGVELGALIADELLAHGAREDGQVGIAGPDLRLQPKAAETIGLAIHELATNAVKYGALANGSGRINVRWLIESRDGKRRLHLDWAEDAGGQAVSPPTRRGFGMDMLERTLAYDLGAEVTLDFAPGGLRCRIELPLDERIVVSRA